MVQVVRVSQGVPRCPARGYTDQHQRLRHFYSRFMDPTALAPRAPSWSQYDVILFTLAKSYSAGLFPSPGELTLLDHGKGKCLFPQAFGSSRGEHQGWSLFLDGVRQAGDQVLDFECSWGNSPHMGVQSTLPEGWGSSGTRLFGSDPRF